MLFPVADIESRFNFHPPSDFPSPEHIAKEIKVYPSVKVKENPRRTVLIYYLIFHIWVYNFSLVHIATTSYFERYVENSVINIYGIRKK